MDITFIQNNIGLFALLAVWEIVWKSVALWKSARHNQLYWFVAIMFINALGLLSIVYLIFFQKERK